MRSVAWLFGVVLLAALIAWLFMFRDPYISEGDKALTAAALSAKCMDAMVAYAAAGKDMSDIPECRYLHEDD